MYDNAKMQHALRFKPLQKPAPIFKIPANFKKPQIFPAQELSFPPENFDRFPAEILHDRVCSAGCSGYSAYPNTSHFDLTVYESHSWGIPS